MDLPVPALEPEATMDDLQIWQNLRKEVEILAATEMILRKKIFNTFFKDPKEGVNNYPLHAGWILKGEHKITRKVLIAEMTTLTPEFNEAGLPMDKLVKSTPELSVSTYKALTDEQKKLFDKCLEIKPGAPSLKIELPKRAQNV